MTDNLIEFPKTSKLKGITLGKCYFITIAGIMNFISVLGTRRIVSLAPIITATTPATGATITANTKQDDETHIVTPAATIATLNLILPSAANSHKGQIIRLQSSEVVSTAGFAVTMAGSGTIGGAALTALAQNTPYAWQCTSVTGVGSWHRIQ